MPDKFSPEMSQAIRNEVKQAMTEWTKTEVFTRQNMEVFWASAFDVLQEKAQEHTGRFVFSSLSAVVRKVSIFVLIGAFVYAVGGWTALAALVKFLFGSGSGG